MRFPLTLLLIALLCASSASGQAASQPARGKATEVGQAPSDLLNAREAAIDDALRRCVETAGGVDLVAMSQTSQFALVADAIYVKTRGFIETYRVLEEYPNQNGLYTVRVEAVVTRGNLGSNVEAFKMLLKRKSRPRVIVVGSVDAKPFDPRLTAEIESTLTRRGFTVIELARLNENTRNAAQQAAKGRLDLLMAALIMAEVNADYLIVASAEGTQTPVQAYGLTLYAVDAVSTIKIIRADTAVLMASEVAKASLKTPTPQHDINAITTTLTQQALQKAIRQTAAAWLEDVDPRSGQQVQVVIYRLPAVRLGRLVDALRKTHDVRDVIIDSANPDARTHLRVIGHRSAADIGLAVQRTDPALTMAGSSKYMVMFDSSKSPRDSARDWRIPIIIAINALAILLIVAIVASSRHRTASAHSR